MAGRILTLAAGMLLLLTLPLQAAPTRAESPDLAGLNGSWVLVPEKSPDIDLFRTLSLKLRLTTDSAVVERIWGRRGREFRDTLAMKLGGAVSRIPVYDRVWASNVFMGVSTIPGTLREATARLTPKGLLVEERYPIAASQGVIKTGASHTFRLSDDGETMTYTLQRSTRKSGPPVVFVLKPQGYHDAYVMQLEDNWEINGKLPLQAFLVSLQGLANTDSARLYFLYPPDWPFTYTESVYDFYKAKRNFSFTKLNTPEQALTRFANFVQGYVVWDRKVRTSLTVAFTVAGLERAVVVDESLIPMVEKAGLKPVADFRGKFTGKSDYEIYDWAYKEYGPRCSKDVIIWLGGEAGQVMKPSVADYGIARKVFFNDLSSRITDTAEYRLADRILDDMNKTGLVMGWHSYAKDLEEEHVTLTSRHGLVVEGLNTLPNTSFSSHVGLSKGFRFRNNHHAVPGKTYTPANKVYVSCIQTDGMGLGAWLKPGRGTIPYGWELTMNWLWLSPAMLEYFYTMATPNDYMIGCLSGPGYMYPKAVPPKLLPGLLARAKKFMDTLDLRVFEIMDYSEGRTIEGNTELAKSVVDAYYEAMPGVIGFVNGYAPGFTFTVRDKKPLISYDYYLSPERPEAQAVADLQELARINTKRPYFLLVHVREWSDVQRVKGILDKLGSGFEVVPLDIFLAMAGQKPTYQQRFLHAQTSILP